MPDCPRNRLEETAKRRLLLLRASLPILGSRRGVDGSHRTQATHAAHCWLRRGQRSSSISG